MNIQKLMKQAKKMQADLAEKQNKISEKEFVGESSVVKITMTGDKVVKDVKISEKVDDMEMLEDMIMIALNQAIDKITAETESELGELTNMMPGMF